MDADELKEEISIEEVLEYYGGDTDAYRGTNWIPMECPFHGEENPSAGYNPVAGAFNCFVCDVAGDIFSIVMDQEDFDFVQAKEFLVETFLKEE